MLLKPRRGLAQPATENGGGKRCVRRTPGFAFDDAVVDQPTVVEATSIDAEAFVDRLEERAIALPRFACRRIPPIG